MKVLVATALMRVPMFVAKTAVEFEQQSVPPAC